MCAFFGPHSCSSDDRHAAKTSCSASISQKYFVKKSESFFFTNLSGLQIQRSKGKALSVFYFWWFRESVVPLQDKINESAYE